MATLRLRSVLSATHALLLATAIAALLYVIFKISSIVLIHAIPFSFSPFICFGAATYLVGHAFRSLRLALLIGGWRIGLRQIVSFHFFTAAVSLAVPLKLGEVYRVTELSYLMGDLIRAIETIWWERIFDVLAIIIILVVVSLSTSGADGKQFFDVAVLAFAFVFVTVLTFFVLPDNLRRLSVLIIRRYESRRSVSLLQGLDRLRRAIIGAPKLVRGKVVSLLVLTALTWTCELICFALVLTAVGEPSSSAPDALLGFLSVITRGYTVFAGFQSGTAKGVLTYLTVTQFPLIFFGTVCAGYYAFRQTNESHARPFG